MRERTRAPGQGGRERGGAADLAERASSAPPSSLQVAIGNAALGRMLGASRRTTGEAALPVGRGTQAEIEAERGRGEPLADGPRVEMEALVDRDLGGARIHTGARPDALAARLGARAFTQGSDVFLRSGAGAETLAHELQHVAEGAPGAGAVVRDEDPDGIDRDEAGWELAQSLSTPQHQAQVVVHAATGGGGPAPTIPDPNAPPPAAKQPQTFDISLVVDNIPKAFSGLTAEAAITELNGQVRRLSGLVDIYRGWHQELIQNREDHPIVGFWADKLGGHGDPPDIGIWSLVGREELSQARAIIGAGPAKLDADFETSFAEQQARVQAIRDQGGPNLNNFAGVRGVEDARESAHDEFIASHVRTAADCVQRAANIIQIRRERVFYYKEGSIKGAERGIAGTKVAIDVLITTASAGVGEVVEGGIAVKAVATGLTQGSLTMYSEGATQTGEMFYGDREWGDFDVAAIKRAGKRAAVNGFIGALAAGKLTKLIDGKVARYVAPVLEDAGINLDNAGLQFVAKGTRDWIVGQIMSPANTVANTMMDVAIDGKQPPKSWGEFYDRIADDFKQSAEMGGVMVALAHGAQATHGTTAPAGEGAPPPRKAPPAPEPESARTGPEPAPGALPEPVPPRTGAPRGAAAVDEIVGIMPSETVMQPADPRDVAGAQVMYENSIVGEPGGPVREAAMYRNTATGEVIVIQGEIDIVQVAPGEAPAPGGKAQRWKEILDARPDIGSWELVAHSHPPVIDPITGAELPHTRLPSGAAGDIGTLLAEAQASGQARSSRLDYLTEGRVEHTMFGVDPASQRPIWIEFIDPVTGIRQPRTFASIEEYHTFLLERGIDPGPIPDAVATALPPRAAKAGVAPDLLSGEGITRPPDTLEELARSNDEVATARGTLAAGTARAELLDQSVVAIAERAVAEYRAVRVQEWARLTHRPASEIRLTGESLMGTCGQGRDLTAEAIASLTIGSAVPVTIDRYQVNNLGIDELHGFAVVRAGDGTPYLVDATYAQFPGDPLTGEAARAEQAASPGRARVSNELLRSGLVALDEVTARNYLLNVGATPEVASAMARELMAGKRAVLREVVQNGKIERRVPGEDVPEDLREADEGLGEHGLITQVDEMIVLTPVGTPEYELLRTLRERLGRISLVTRPVKPRSIL